MGAGEHHDLLHFGSAARRERARLAGEALHLVTGGEDHPRPRRPARQARPRHTEVYAIARQVVAEVDQQWTERLGNPKMRRLRELLEELNAGL